MKLSANIVAAISWIIAFVLGFIPLFFGSIISACIAFDSGALTGKIILWTIIKCLLAPSITWIYAFVLAILIYICIDLFKRWFT